MLNIRSFFYLCYMFHSIIDRVATVGELKCAKMNYNSTEFRISSGGYTPTSVTPALCKELCGDENFAYTAVMDLKYCLCGFSDQDFEQSILECNAPCFEYPDLICGSLNTDTLLISKVELLKMWSIEMVVTLDETNEEPTSLVYFDCNVRTNITQYDINIDYGDGSVAKARESPVKFQKHLRVPGIYKAKVIAFDTITTQLVENEVKFRVPEWFPKVVFNCPTLLKPEQNFSCNATVLRGTELTLTVTFDKDDPEIYDLPDADVKAFGPSITEPDESAIFEEKYFTDTVFIHHSLMASGIILGFELLAAKPGDVEIQIWTPECLEPEKYCGSCREDCPDEEMLQCSKENVILSPSTHDCVDKGNIASEMQDVKRTLKYTFPTTVDERGYHYIDVFQDPELKKVKQGDALAFKAELDPVVAYRKPNQHELNTKELDMNLNGEFLEARHFLRVLVSTPMNVSVIRSFYERGTHSAVLEATSNDVSDYKDTQPFAIDVEEPISGVNLSLDSACVQVGLTKALQLSVSNGTHMIVDWTSDNEETKNTYIEFASNGIAEETFYCQQQKNFTVFVNISNPWHFESDEETFCCLNPVSRSWKMQTNSPQISPPGYMELSLRFLDNEITYPGMASVDINYGDESASEFSTLEWGKENLSLSHTYDSGGFFNVTFNISNSVDHEIFVIEVQLFDKMDLLEVTAMYFEDVEMTKLLPLHGNKKTDVPANSSVQFLCEINGTVFHYIVNINDALERTSESKVIVDDFNEVGKFSAKFKAWNPLESSNEVVLDLRIMTSTVNLKLEADTVQIQPGEDVSFLITFASTDPFTCLSFDPGDGSVKQTFGNQNSCLEVFRTEDMVYNEEQTDLRRKRETKKANWVDSQSIAILHTYENPGSYDATAEAFNTIFRTGDAVRIDVMQPPSTIWIENNSTNIKNPMKKFRKDNFRLETTALLTDVKTYLYEMVWNVYEITRSGSPLREIDISDIVSQNCSALRFPSRYLDVGLYKVVYTIYITDNSTIDDVNTTIVDTPSCFTYLEIESSPLRSMIFRGGDSYVLRGLGQNVYLQPEIYSEDPNDLEDKNFEVQWTCKRLERSIIGTVEENNLSGSVINRNKLDEAELEGGCFKTKESKLVGGNLVINTEDMWGTTDFYHIEMFLRKDTRSVKTWLFLDVIEKMPPGIIIRCEKKVACEPVEGGLLVNHNDWLALRAECVSECGDGKLKYEWNVYGVEMPSFNRREFDDLKHFIVVDMERFGINQTLFASHKDLKSYHVKVTGTTSDGRPSGVAKMYVYINMPPEPGTCELSAESGMAVIEQFSIDFKGWTDPEDHWLKDFGIYMRHRDYLYHIHYGEKKNVNFILPYGDIEVICSVTDIHGATTRLTAGIIKTEEPLMEEMKNWTDSTNLMFTMVEGKLSVVAQAIAAGALMALEKRKGNYETIDEETERIRAKFCNLPGIDSSYFTIQAREEIEAQVSDERDANQAELADVNQKLFEAVQLLPFEVLYDSEVYGVAVSALAESRPLNRESKNILSSLLKVMYESSVKNEVPHPEDQFIANMIIGNSMNCLVKTISQERLGGKFLRSELDTMFEFLKVNYTQPNFFFLYVNGSRWEVEERVHDFKADGIRNLTQEEALEQTRTIKNITDAIVSRIAQDLLVNALPLVVDSTSGFYLDVEKKPAQALSDATISDGHTAVSLPSGCVLVGAPLDCNLEDVSLGVTIVKFTGVTHFQGAEKVRINPNANSLELNLVNQDGNQILDVKDSAEPFQICLPIEGPDFDEKKRKGGQSTVIPLFKRSSDFIIYHSLKISSGEATVKADLMPSIPNAPLVVFYAIGFKPSLLAHDGMHFLQDVAEENGIYSLLLDLSGFDVVENDRFYLAVGHLAPDVNTKVFNGSKNLTRDDMTNDFSCNYTISISTTGCYFFKEEDSTWSAEGCRVKSANSSMICCLCNHLTLFGGGLLVAPNAIDFSNIFSNFSFDDNLAIYLTLILTFASYILIVIWARWKDRKDLQKLGATPLPDNDLKDKYLYEILVQTGHQMSAATTSKVHFILSGEDEETDVRTFGDGERSIFKCGAIDLFVMVVPRCLGQLNYFRIWHDNSGKGKYASWFLKFIVVKDVVTGLKYEFMVDRWLAVEESDGLIDLLIPVAGKEQTNEFSHLFSAASRHNFSDNHLWFSVFLRPPRSRFTRVQRVSCCLAVLYLSMLASAMWYQTTTSKPTNAAFEFGPLSLSPEQISVGLMTNLVVFPPSFLMIMIFRKTRPRVLRPSHLDEALKLQNDRWQKEYGQGNGKGPSQDKTSDTKERKLVSEADEEAQLRHRKKKKTCTLPWWFVFIGWFLVIVSVGCCLFFLWAYGLQFGNEKTSKWLTSLVISFISSIFLTEPLKIFFFAILMSCFCGNPDLNDDDAVEDEEDPRLKNDEQWLHKLPEGANIRRPKYRPMDQRALELARQKREKEIKMYQVLRETSTYVVYLWVLMVLSFGNRDPNSFFLRRAIINNFIKPGDLWNDFGTINNEVRFWNWTREALIPELFANKWYNGRIPLGLRLFTDDRSNFKIGYAVLRQVRAKPGSCTVSERMDHLVSECAGYGTMVFEDGVFHGPLWNRDVSIEDVIPTEFKYMTASDLNGYPFWGALDWYGGGGYIYPLIAKRYEDGAKLIEQMHILEQTGWIDKRTRAVFIEFGTYNAQVNLFTVVTIIAEFVPGGGIVPYYHIDPIKLLQYHTGAGLLQLICQIAFLIFIGFYTVSELTSMFKQGCKYFSEYWNLAEVANLLAAYAAIFVEVYKMFITWRILRIFRETEGTGYIKLQEALLLDESFSYLIGFLMSLATLKFLKLLRFNKRIGSMAVTIKLCAEELSGFAICLMIVFVAFVIMFWMVLGRAVREFCSFLSTFESSISMILKKFNYHDIETASPVLGPLIFFTFALTASVVLINLLLTIIIQSFEEVKHDVSLQSSEHELVPFIINRLKLMTGIGKPKIHALPPLMGHLSDKKTNKYDAVVDFPTKVDKLLEFINSVYFEEKMDFDNKDFLKRFKSNGDDPTSDVKSSENSKPKPKKVRPTAAEAVHSGDLTDYLDF